MSSDQLDQPVTTLLTSSNSCCYRPTSQLSSSDLLQVCRNFICHLNIHKSNTTRQSICNQMSWGQTWSGWMFTAERSDKQQYRNSCVRLLCSPLHTDTGSSVLQVGCTGLWCHSRGSQSSRGWPALVLWTQLWTREDNSFNHLSNRCWEQLNTSVFLLGFFVVVVVCFFQF